MQQQPCLYWIPAGDQAINHYQIPPRPSPHFIVLGR
jgi:hypothetical protein